MDFSQKVSFLEDDFTVLQTDLMELKKIFNKENAPISQIDENKENLRGFTGFFVRVFG